MEKKENQQSTTLSEKPIGFTKLVGEAVEEQKEKVAFEKKEYEKLPPTEVKPKKKVKSSESEKRERKRELDARYRMRKKEREGEKAGIVAEPELKPFELIDRETLKVFAGIVPFSILAMVLHDERYLCNDHEKEVLAAQWDKYIRIRIPDVLDRYGPEYALGLNVAMFLIEKSGIFKPGTVEKEFEKKTETGIKGYE